MVFDDVSGSLQYLRASSMVIAGSHETFLGGRVSENSKIR